MKEQSNTNKKDEFIAILVQVGEAPKVITCKPELESKYNLLGCDMIECAFNRPTSDRNVSIDCVVDEEGKFNENVNYPNRAIYVDGTGRFVADEQPDSRCVDVIFGDFLVIAYDDETGDMTDIPMADLQENLQFFSDATTGVKAVLDISPTNLKSINIDAILTRMRNSLSDEHARRTSPTNCTIICDDASFGSTDIDSMYRCEEPQTKLSDMNEMMDTSARTNTETPKSSLGKDR